jgi:hypothetical protein
MPKEIAHWTLAEDMAKEIPKGSLFYKPIQDFSNLFFLGATAPDIPFYYLAGPKRACIQEKSIPFHGTDARALKPVLAFLDQNPNSDPDRLAFAAGVICHILGDTIFHPLVYYFSGMGGIHPGATARHRQFETAMDLHFWYLSDDKSRASLGRLVRTLEISKQKRKQFMAELFKVVNRSETRYLCHALSFHMTLQYLFRLSMAWQFFDFLNRKTPWVPDRVTGLIYPCKQPVDLPFFRQEFIYKDPCTGDLLSTGIQTMIQETSMAGKKILGLLSRSMDNGRNAVEILDDPDLPMIRPGLPRNSFYFWRGINELEQELYGGLDSNICYFSQKNRRSWTNDR